MSRVVGALAVGLALLISLPRLTAEDAPPVTGSLVMGGKTYKLMHVVAYETKAFDEPAIAVLASDRPIALDKIKTVLKEHEGSDERLFLSQPHVKVTFEKSGKIKFASAWAANFSTSTSGDDLSGEVKLEGDRAIGKVKLASQGEGELQRSFEFDFAVGMLGSAAEEAPKAAPLAKLGVSGTYKANGKEAKLAFVSAVNDEEFSGQPGLVLIFSEKDHSKDRNPKLNVSFGRYGSALIISCHEDGGIYSCQVGHAGLEKRGVSSLGDIESGEFQVAGGQVQGKLTTNGPAEVFGETWEANLTFAAPYKSQIKAPASGRGDAPKKTAARETPSDEPTKPEPTKPAKPAVAALKAKDLALPKGATDAEYKTLVEHISFKCPGDIKTVAAEFSKALAAQGWTKEGSDLLGTNCILNRKRGEAELTIFVKPDGAGSKVTMFTEGLVWDE